MGRKRKGGYHHGDLRSALLDEALTLLLEQGIDAVTIRRIASRLDVSHAAPQHHFRTRGRLMAALAGRGFAELRAAMLSAREAAGDEGALGAIGLSYVRFAIERPPLFRLMFSNLVAESEVSDDEREQAAACQRILSEALATTCAPGEDELDSDVGTLPPQALASWSLVHGLATLYIDGQVEPFFAGPDGKERFMVAVAAVLAG